MCERARHRQTHDFSKPQGGRDSDSDGDGGCYSISQLSSSCLLTSKPKPSQSHRVASQSQAKPSHGYGQPAVKEPKEPKLKPQRKLKPSSQVNSRQEGQEQNEPYWFFTFSLPSPTLPLPTNSLPSLHYTSVGLHIIANNSNSRQKCYL